MTCYVFIDITNLHMGVSKGDKPEEGDYVGWNIDWQKFHTYLCDTYRIGKIYCFTGYNPKNTELYSKLVNIGYTFVHKPMIPVTEGLYKGNCDAEMVLYAVDKQNEYDHAVLVTGDGDFYCLAKYLIDKGKLLRIISPRFDRTSSLIKGFGPKFFMTAQDIRSKIEYKKTP